LEKVTKLILAITAELAIRSIDLQVRIVTPNEGYFYLFDKPIFELNSFNTFRTGYRGMTYIIGRSFARINVSTEEEIEAAYFCIDGNFIPIKEQTPPYKLKIQGITFPLMGKHTISVYVYTTSKKVAYDEMDLFVCCLSYAMPLLLFELIYILGRLIE
jgi:hypothetical protein